MKPDILGLAVFGFFMSLDLDTLVQDAWRHADRYFEVVKSYPYHNRGHTERALSRAMELSRREHVGDRDRLEIAVAVVFHDTGFASVYDRNEPVGAEYARAFAREAGLDEAATERIGSLVLATALGSPAPTLAHAIVQDADLDNLGLDSGVVETLAIYREITLFSRSDETWADWLEKSARLFTTHRYATATARAEREAGQEKNAHILRTMLEMEREAAKGARG